VPSISSIASKTVEIVDVMCDTFGPTLN
jgi:hypothetical protein